MSNTFEVKFNDLKPEVQQELLNFLGVESASEINGDIYTVAIIEKPEEQ